MFIQQNKYYVYIITDANKKVLYTGFTNNLEQRITEHYLQRGVEFSFTGKYHTYNLLYYEGHDYVLNAIAREKQIKDWRRRKKVTLINAFNPQWKFLNKELFGEWPPENPVHRKSIPRS